MGYTRYYHEVKVDFFKKEFVDKVKTIIKKAKEDYGVVVRNWEGVEEPEIDIRLISLNGDATTEDLSHETFTLRNHSQGFNCCKTAEKPYDMVVHAILELAQRYGYVTGVKNDGETDLDEQAEKLLEEALKNV